jgi:hypothetical protein
MDSVRSGPYGQIFRPDNFVFGQVSITHSHDTVYLALRRHACALSARRFSLHRRPCRECRCMLPMARLQVRVFADMPT